MNARMAFPGVPSYNIIKWENSTFECLCDAITEAFKSYGHFGQGFLCPDQFQEIFNSSIIPPFTKTPKIRVNLQLFVQTYWKYIVYLLFQTPQKLLITRHYKA